jgi:steroid 5-alpha reductase family enzyme
MVFVISLFIAIASQTVVYGAVYANADAAACDAASTLSVVFVCVGALVYKGEYLSRQCAVTFLMGVWGVRLAWHVWRRQRVTAPKLKEYVFARVLWSTLVALPAVLLNISFDYGTHPGMFRQSEDVPFFVVALLSVTAEHVADETKRLFYAKSDEADASPVCQTGLWKWSRHPNYFAEIAFHVSIYVLVAKHTPLFACAGILITLYACILSDGGVAGLESKRHSQFYLQTWYRTYKKRTSPFVPFPPETYEKLPFAVKRWVFLELPSFEVETFHFDRQAHATATSMHDDMVQIDL